MSETNNQEKKLSTLKLSSTKLTLGGVKSGLVPQSLSGGRVKNVTVEVKKVRRPFGLGQNSSGSAEHLQDLPSAANNSEFMSGGGLTSEERTMRMRVLQQAVEHDKQLKIEQGIAAQEQLKQALIVQNEELKLAREKVAENIKDAANEEVAPKKAENEKSYDFVNPIKTSERASVPAKEVAKKPERAEEEVKPAKAVKTEQKRRSNKLTIAQALSASEEKVRSLASVRRAREKARRAAGLLQSGPKEKIIREVVIPEVISVQELSNRMAERVYDVVKMLMKMGMMVTSHQTIDADTAELVVSEFGHNSRRVTDADVEDILKVFAAEDEGKMEFRAPVVTFMGHVDHGKTSLLDAIRQTQVASGEAGGITQHIGAYQVKTPDGEKITFLDTPGHEAFTAMRKRGAHVTDVVVLVVAADDGIMAQTREAISHAKAAEVPIIVAINKIDKPGANPMAIKNSLLEFGLVAEDLGGDLLVVEVSAKARTNIDKLLEAILLQAEILDLKANPNRKAQGIVVEASVDKSKGALATILVQNGTLRVGDIIVAGTCWGKVKAMLDSAGRMIHIAGPSVPAQVLGLEGAPEAGSETAVVDSEKQAREITEYRLKLSRDLKSTAKRKGSIDDLFRIAKDGGKKELNILIKGDVQGSVEAIVASLEKLATDEVAARILHYAVGGITTSDITLAGASNAIILGFNVRADSSAKEMALREGADIRYYSIIYDLIDDIKAIMGGMLSPARREQYLGTAEIREVFSLPKKSTKIAGCFVTDGVIRRGSGVRLLRDNVVVYEGTLKTLRRFKDDVKEVGNNFECGISFENYDDIKPGDNIEAFEVFEEKRSL
jgi:translation initiation factor IF-2